MFTAFASLRLDSEYIQFQIICLVSCSIIVDAFKVDPHSIQYEIV